MPSRGSAAADTGDSPYAALLGGRTRGGVQFSDLSGECIARACDAVTRRGDAVMFARTSDGGAVAVHVLHDKLVTKWYAKNVEELQELLDALAELG